MTVRVTHIITTSLHSGAGRSVLLLHRSLLNKGWDSRVLVYGEKHEEKGIVSLSTWKKWLWRLGVVVERLFYYGLADHKQVRRFHFHSPLFGLSLDRINAVRESDIIHLHWVAAAGVRWNHLSRCNKPLVWTFRDYWPLTGLCHFPGTCKNFLDGCGKCPKLKRPSPLDVSHQWVQKKAHDLPPRSIGVAISQFQLELARRSTIWKGANLRCIPNGIDQKKWRQTTRAEARKCLNLPLERSLLAFGSFDFYEPHKGFLLLRELAKRPEWDNCTWLFFGTANEDGMKELGVDYQNMGVIGDDSHMQMIYAAANVFVAPFFGEPFGKAIVECMAAGTGCVAYANSGAADTVVDGTTGVLLNTENTDIWASAINWVIRASNEQEFIKANQNRADQFDIEIISHQYINLYESVLNGY